MLHLTAKLYVPTPRPALVARSRLIERLDEGLRLGHRLTLVAAPAGFGKTTLVAEWVSRGGRPVAWLSLDEGDNDPVRFISYLIAALQGADASVGRTVQDILGSPQVSPLPTLLTPLVNDLAAAGRCPRRRRVGGALLRRGRAGRRPGLRRARAGPRQAVRRVGTALVLPRGPGHDRACPRRDGSGFETLRQARALTGEEGLSDPGWLLAREAELHLRVGDVALAERWAQDTGITVDDEPDYLRFEEHLAFARLLLAQGRFGDARSWLDRLERFARARECFRWLITVQILQAVAAERSALHSTSRDHLTWALRLAAPEGYLRAFLDEGPFVVGMLPAVRQAAPAFVARLVDAAGVSGLKPALAVQALAEPLSERELEVLGSIAQGLSNQEVAARLIIAHGTVKRHLDNIYRKLGARSRTQAVAKARALRLI